MVNYLIRLDDACPQMHLEKWERVECILNKYSIKPIVAVIPDNKDETLFFNYNENFWTSTINRWQKNNWNLALHGYQHLYHPTSKKSIVQFKNKSEFTGDDYQTQKDKILKGIEILNEYSINPKIFIAPGHAFDEITIEVLKNETSIKVVSDGFSFRPYKINGMCWVPQQLWNFRKMPFGTWTFCLHPNTMLEQDFLKMDKWLQNNNSKVISFEQCLSTNLQNKNLNDILFEKMLLIIRKTK